MKDFGGVLLLISLTMASHAQSKGDNIIEVSNTKLDSVVSAFAVRGYEISNYYQGLAARLSYLKVSPFGNVTLTLSLFNGKDSVIRIAARADNYEIMYNGTWKKEFVAIAAQAAASGGKISYARKEWAIK